MSDQLDRIHDYCDKLKSHPMALEWSAIADSTVTKEEAYEYFFEQVFHVEQQARDVRSKKTRRWV